MKKTDIEIIVKETLVNILKLDLHAEELSANTLIIEELNLNSSSFIEVQVALEDAFMIEIDDENLDISNFHSISSLVDMIDDSLNLA